MAAVIVVAAAAAVVIIIVLVMTIIITHFSYISTQYRNIMLSRLETKEDSLR
jgi:hypothetical protein